ncbi:hypothetical protein ACHAXT_012732 [Thalassiosira profunda]
MPRTKRAVKRVPPSGDSCLLVAWIFVLVSAVVALVYLAIDAVMGGPQYLYHKEDGDDSTYAPVIEYQGNDTKPNWLYQPDAGDFSPPPRLVEFYAPWCPHCRHYVPQYIKLAKKVTAAQPSIQFYAVSCVAHKDVCKDQGIRSYPTVKVFAEGSYEKLNVTRKGIKDANSILEVLGFEGTAADGEKEEEKPNKMASKSEYEAVHKKLRDGKHKPSDAEKAIARVIPYRVHDVHDAWFDAAESFEFALKNSIYMENGPLPKEKATAFKEWLELLAKSLPNQMFRTHGIVNTILEHFAEATSGQKKLDALAKEHAYEEPKWGWRTCTYGDNKMGYTCGLWQLFHIMSVGVVEYNTHNPPIPTRHVSETLRNYIDHFFQCDVCRLNFLDMYDTCAFDGCHRLSEQPSTSEKDWQELPLWLWETHNDVNVRLLGERLDANKEAKPNGWESQQARYPALFACPNCWRPDGSWEEEEVFKFLRSMYWTGNISYLKTPSEDLLDGSRVGAFHSLRWKVSAIVFAVVALLGHLSSKRIPRKTKK